MVEAVPPGVDAGALRQATAEAFVSGMHASFLTAGAVLLVGALIALVFVAPAPGTASGTSGALSRAKGSGVLAYARQKIKTSEKVRRR